MSGTNGFNFAVSQRARSSEVNQNFEWFRGHYLPVTQSSTWANTTGVYDLGNSTYKWRDAYLTGSITAAALTASGTITTGDLSLSGSIMSGSISKAVGTTTSFSTATLSTGASDSRTITHGLGTDNVKILAMGKGSDSVYVAFWKAIARRPDGTLILFKGNDEKSFSISPPSVPPSGSINIVTLNDAPTVTASQAITVSLSIIRE